MLRSALSALLAAATFVGSAAAKKPNVLVIMSDDQDMLLDSLSVMPNVKSLIGDHGITYNKHYCTVAWCCPSRVNFLTGKAAHNTNVTAVSPPYGGWPKFGEQELNDNYLPVWLQSAGVRTYYIGKFMNAYAIDNRQTPVYPKGWDFSTFLVDPWTYNYHQSHWITQHDNKITAFPGIHTTAVTQKKVLNLLKDVAAHPDDQFFIMVAPVAPHVEVTTEPHAPPPPDSFKDNFVNAIAPRRAKFNPDTPSGASWVKNLSKLDSDNIKACDSNHVARLQNIGGVDSMVATILNQLQEYNLLDNTYVIYHIGNHRLLPGKRCPYEEDINIPLLVRGPGVPEGVTTEITNHHTDMAPTILQMLGVPLRGDFDGEPIAYTQDKLFQPELKHEHVQVEFWDGGGGPDFYRDSAGTYYNNTYKALRLVDGGYSFYYSVWCSGEHEFYDMQSDFVQMNNLLAKGANTANTQFYGRPFKQIIQRLDTLLLVLKACKQDSCRAPWNMLFPNFDVGGIAGAMDKKYDAFFAKQPSVSFSSCHEGYIPGEEGAMEARIYVGGS